MRAYVSSELGELYFSTADELIDLMKKKGIEFDLSVFSPPYWNKIPQFVRDREDFLGNERTSDEYIRNIGELVTSLGSIIKPQGFLSMFIGDSWMDNSWCLIPQRISLELKKRGWNIINTISWTKQYEDLSLKGRIGKCTRSPQDGRLIHAKDNIIIANRSPHYYFNKQDKQLVDVWFMADVKRPADYDFEVIPVKILQNLIRLLCPNNGSVLDPFMGSGSTALACENLGIKWMGCEPVEKYIKVAERRIKNRRS